MSKNFEILCPCCESTIVVDRITGEILIHKVKETRGPGGTLESMVSNLEAQKSEAAKRFERNLESQKDRARILEERFKEALQRADKEEKPHVNPFDFD